MDRKTGKPIENVSIELLNKTLKTDKNGLASYIKENNNYNYGSIEIATAADTLFINNHYLRYNNDYANIENKKPTGKIEFYLDRAIYRPGQTVYYKGVAIQKNKDKKSLKNKNSKIKTSTCIIFYNLKKVR